MSVDDDFRPVLEICKGDYKAALRLVLLANVFYEQETERLKQEASAGYGRAARSASQKRRAKAT